MKRICSICARGGSKGVPGKNIRILCGLPLIAHSVQQARATGLFSHLAVSSDCDLILAAAAEAGADILIKRPPELATDQAAKLPAIRHCFLESERISGERFDTIVDLDATSPLRLSEDIIGAVRMFEAGDAVNLITGAPSRRSPYFNLVELDEKGFAHLVKGGPTVVRRQDAPRCFDMNGSVYVWNRESLFTHDTVINERTAFYEMPEERSIDIDSSLDFAFVTFIMEGRNRGDF
jgi:CMP-N,N'-diacetyllegionaminic acid synthase